MWKRIRHWYYQRKIKQAVKILHNLDSMTIRAGYSRQARRQFWRDFYKDRTEVMNFLQQATSQKR